MRINKATELSRAHQVNYVALLFLILLYIVCKGFRKVKMFYTYLLQGLTPFNYSFVALDNKIFKDLKIILWTTYELPIYIRIDKNCLKN